jgi:hypothetical protein
LRASCCRKLVDRSIPPLVVRCRSAELLSQDACPSRECDTAISAKFYAIAGGPTSENTKAAARAVFEVWSTGAIERFDDLVARDDCITMPELNRRAFPDMRLVVEDRVPARALADNGTG